MRYDPDEVPGLVEYENIPIQIATVISAKLATLQECATVYSVEDIYLLLEIVAVDAHNQRRAEDHARKE